MPNARPKQRRVLVDARAEGMRSRRSHYLAPGQQLVSAGGARTRPIMELCVWRGEGMEPANFGCPRREARARASE